MISINLGFRIFFLLEGENYLRLMKSSMKSEIKNLDEKRATIFAG